MKDLEHGKRTIIAGSRGFAEYSLLVLAIAASGFKICEVVSGTAGGADTLGERFAQANSIPVKRFPAAWHDLLVPGAIIRTGAYGKYNARAGHDRNIQMAQYADQAICLWDGVSTGTKHMIQEMKKLGKPVYVHNYGEDL